MVNVSVLYRYSWQGEARAMRAHLLGEKLTVVSVNPESCETVNPVGVFDWINGAVVGSDKLAETHRGAIAAILSAALEGGLNVENT